MADLTENMSTLSKIVDVSLNRIKEAASNDTNYTQLKLLLRIYYRNDKKCESARSKYKTVR